MAYQARDLSALGYANGFTLWHYRTKDSALAVVSDGYFNPASRMLRVGDFILVNAAIDSTPPAHAVIVVTKNEVQEVQIACVSEFAPR